LDWELDVVHRRAVEAHLEECAGCREDVAALEGTIMALQDVPPVPDGLFPPSLSMRSKLETRPEWARWERDRAEDPELIARSRRGDPTAFVQWADEHLARLFGACLRLLGVAEGAREIAQETVLQAYLGLDGLPDGSRFEPWLARIAVNLCLTHLRRPGPAAAPLPDPEPPPDRAATRPKEVVGIRALQRLSLDLRATVVLRDSLRCSYAEIAEVLEVPLETVASRISAARWAFCRAQERADDL
jgi:RNA polymerase sigma-70 factor (ECF subfamily)